MRLGVKKLRQLKIGALRQQLIVCVFRGFFVSIALLKPAILIKPSTLLKLDKALIKRKYRLLFSGKNNKKPGPAGPSAEIIETVVAMTLRNPRFSCCRIVMQISHTFGVDVDKYLVYRICTGFQPSPIE